MKDTRIQKLLAAEKKRQKSVINLVASENYVSDDVLSALGTETTNKYAKDIQVLAIMVGMKSSIKSKTWLSSEL